MGKVKITVGDISLIGELRDTKLARKISEALPIESVADTWGDEIYFTIPIEVEALEYPQKTVKIGDLAYWPQGNAFCIFFGRTPISFSKEKISPASEVEVIGILKKGFEKLKKVRPGQLVRVEAA